MVFTSPLVFLGVTGVTGVTSPVFEGVSPLKTTICVRLHHALFSGVAGVTGVTGVGGVTGAVAAAFSHAIMVPVVALIPAAGPVAVRRQATPRKLETASRLP